MWCDLIYGYFTFLYISESILIGVYLLLWLIENIFIPFCFTNGNYPLILFCDHTTRRIHCIDLWDPRVCLLFFLFFCFINVHGFTFYLKIYNEWEMFNSLILLIKLTLFVNQNIDLCTTMIFLFVYLLTIIRLLFFSIKLQKYKYIREQFINCILCFDACRV